MVVDFGFGCHDSACTTQVIFVFYGNHALFNPFESLGVTVSPSAETRNLRPNTHFRGTNKTKFMLIFDYSGLQKGMMAMLER